MDFVYQTDYMSYETCYQSNEQKAIQNAELQTDMSQLLLDLVEEGDQNLEIIPDLLPFHSAKIPQISLYDYIGRIMKQAQCSQECLILGLIYMDRISQKYQKIVVGSINVHRLLYVTCVMVAAKFYDDRFFQNQYYAKVAGISKEEFNNLETTLVFLMDFRLITDPTVFFKYRQRILLAYSEVL